MKTTDTAQRLAKLRQEFNRLKVPEASELAMSAEDLSRLVGEIRAEGRALLDQLQVLVKSGREPALVSEIAGRLERTLSQLKHQDQN